MLEKKYNYINGNIVQKPLRREESFEEKQRQEQIERAKRERRKLQKRKQANTIKSVLQVSGVFLMLGVIALYRDGQVYNMQRNLTKMGKEIKTISAEGEALRVTLLKGASLEKIEKDAIDKLGMVRSTKNDVVFIDTSQDFLGELRPQEK